MASSTAVEKGGEDDFPTTVVSAIGTFKTISRSSELYEALQRSPLYYIEERRLTESSIHIARRKLQEVPRVDVPESCAGPDCVTIATANVTLCSGEEVQVITPKELAQPSDTCKFCASIEVTVPCCCHGPTCPPGCAGTATLCHLRSRPKVVTTGRRRPLPHTTQAPGMRPGEGTRTEQRTRPLPDTPQAPVMRPGEGSRPDPTHVPAPRTEQRTRPLPDTRQAPVARP